MICQQETRLASVFVRNVKESGINNFQKEQLLYQKSMDAQLVDVKMDKSLSVNEEYKLHGRYWTGTKGEPMGISRRQLSEKVDRLKRQAAEIHRHVKRIDIPTVKEIKEADVWDEESLEEMDEYLTNCLKLINEAEKEVNRLTKPFRNDDRPPYQPAEPMECPNCNHKFSKKGRNKNEDS